MEIVQAPDIGVQVLSDAEIEAPAFKKKRSHGKFPMLELQDGTVIFESNAIAQYIASRSKHSEDLLGANPFEAALITQW